MIDLFFMELLEIGTQAPDFKGVNQNGKELNLKSFAGKKLILYFYPKDMTPGCTTQACNLTDNYDELLKNGYEVLGVSPDSEEQHIKFIDKYDLPFDLLADESKEIIEKYGLWVEKNMYGRKYMGVKRTTFVIDEKGIIIDIISKVKTKDHANQILSN